MYTISVSEQAIRLNQNWNERVTIWDEKGEKFAVGYNSSKLIKDFVINHDRYCAVHSKSKGYVYIFDSKGKPVVRSYSKLQPDDIVSFKTTIFHLIKSILTL